MLGIAENTSFMLLSVWSLLVATHLSGLHYPCSPTDSNHFVNNEPARLASAYGIDTINKQWFAFDGSIFKGGLRKRPWRYNSGDIKRPHD